MRQPGYSKNLGLIALLSGCLLTSICFCPALLAENTPCCPETILFEKEIAPKCYKLSVEEALSMAQEQNSLFNITIRETHIAKLDKYKSFLDLLPDLSTSTRYLYNTNIADLGSGGSILIPQFGEISVSGFEVQQHWTRETSVSATQTVTGLYKEWQQKKIADLTFEKALLQQQYRANDLDVQVYTVFFDILTAQSSIESVQQNIKDLEALQTLTKEHVELGMALARDLQKVEIRLDQTNQTLLEETNKLDILLLQAKRLLGLPLCSDLKFLCDYTPSDFTYTPEEACQIALKNNQELKQAELNTDIAKYQRRAAYSSYIPDVDVSVSYVNQSGSSFIPQNNMALSFDMSFVPFDWGKRELTLKQHRLRLEQSRFAAKDLQDRLIIQIHESFKKLEEAKNLVKIAEKAVKLAENNLEISQGRYENGFSIINEVISDQADLADARHTYNKSVYDLQKERLSLKQLMGISVEQE